MSNTLTVQRNRPVQVKPKQRQPVSIGDRERMVALCLEGRTIKQIAKKLDRSEHTVRNVLRSPEAVARKEQLAQDVRDAVRLKLIRAAHRAVDSWIKQLDHADAGVKAQHLPAKDLLTHTGVLDIPSPKRDDKPQITIQIGGSDIPHREIVEAEETVEEQTIEGQTVDGAKPVAELPAAVTDQPPDDDSSS